MQNHSSKIRKIGFASNAQANGNRVNITMHQGNQLGGLQAPISLGQAPTFGQSLAQHNNTNPLMQARFNPNQPNNSIAPNSSFAAHLNSSDARRSNNLNHFMSPQIKNFGAGNPNLQQEQVNKLFSPQQMFEKNVFARNGNSQHQLGELRTDLNSQPLKINAFRPDEPKPIEARYSNQQTLANGSGLHLLGTKQHTNGIRNGAEAPTFGNSGPSGSFASNGVISRNVTPQRPNKPQLNPLMDTGLTRTPKAGAAHSSLRSR